MATRYHVLVIEDNRSDFLLIERQIPPKGAGGPLSLCVESGRVECRPLRKGEWEVVLCDYRVPTMDFQETLCLFQEQRPDVPLILVSGSIGKKRRWNSSSWGYGISYSKTDFQAWVRLLSAGCGMLRLAGRGKRPKRHWQLPNSDTAPFLKAPRKAFWLPMEKPALSSMPTRPPAASWATLEGALMREQKVEDILPKDNLAGPASYLYQKHVSGENTQATGVPFLRKDGAEGRLDINTAPVEMDGRRCLVGFFTDVTERLRLEAKNKALEMQLLQAQKLEAVGRLARRGPRLQ